MADPAQLGILQKLAAMLGGHQASANLGTAMTPQYTNYVREMKAQGLTPLTMQQWLQQQAAPQPSAPQPAQLEAPPKPFQF